MDDSDEEHEEEEQMLLTCVLVVSYLCSQREERPSCHVRDRLEWEIHMEELTAEGSDAFQQL